MARFIYVNPSPDRAELYYVASSAGERKLQEIRLLLTNALGPHECFSIFRDSIIADTKLRPGRTAAANYMVAWITVKHQKIVAPDISLDDLNVFRERIGWRPTEESPWPAWLALSDEAKEALLAEWMTEVEAGSMPIQEYYWRESRLLYED